MHCSAPDVDDPKVAVDKLGFDSQRVAGFERQRRKRRLPVFHARRRPLGRVPQIRPQLVTRDLAVRLLVDIHCVNGIDLDVAGDKARDMGLRLADD